ncbi:hypothetical protein [Brachybacterium phenoliresistens]|uniref:hypothetical protein n=1 Tax=Brachybacterium phenoliresistens TaxID=396014 RepID=UPI0031CFE8E0
MTTSEDYFEIQDAWEAERIRDLVARRDWATLLPETTVPVWIHAPGAGPARAGAALDRIRRASETVGTAPEPEHGLLVRILSARARREHRERIAAWTAPYTEACEQARSVVRPVAEADDLVTAAVILDLDPACEARIHELLWRMADHDDARRDQDGGEGDVAHSQWLELALSYEESDPDAFDAHAGR